MCWFITIAVPSAAAAAVCAAHSGRGMAITPTHNPAARAGSTPLLVTGGGCSCAWYRPPAAASADDALARARRAYEKKGWRPAKIARALASMRARPRPDDGLHPVIIDMLAALFARHGPVSLWVHDFSGNVETEPYTITAHTTWPASDLAAHAALLAPDTLATVTPPPHT